MAAGPAKSSTCRDIAALHLHTIETLALAIEAKDHTTSDHVQRVGVYAVELGKDLGLSESEIEALKAASVLHDIGKLAVPEHIICKPGKLTPEEFEKIKVHPIVGAEIVENIRFPYPVAPIVRHHHEKWDGSGYPDGLAGEAIPIGARILSVVDCLDALATDRQYRRAMPLEDAMAFVEKEAGRAFDPRVVAVLKARYVELERLVRAQQPEERPKLSTDIKVPRGAAPGTGFGTVAPTAPETAIAAPIRALDETSSFEYAVSAIAGRLRHRIAYDALAVFAGADDLLTPCFVLGENAGALSFLRVRRGKGLVGWVAGSGNPIVNGNPTVEPGFMEGVPQPVILQSALAVPLTEAWTMVGVLALYRLEEDAFVFEDLTVIQPTAQLLGRVVAEYLVLRQSARKSLANFLAAKASGG